MSMNDPKWGGNNEGPPDIDELWKKFNKNLNGLFGKRKTPNGTQPGSSGPKGGFKIFLIIFLFLWIASGFYIVDASERGVVLRFGKYITTTEPGPRWHFPWPIESAEIVNVSQVFTVEVGYRSNVRSKVLNESLMLTDDENIVDLQFAVQYIRANPESYLFFDRNPDATVKQVAESAIREIVGKSKMDFVLYEGREEIAMNAKTLMQSILDRYKTGISISQVTMQNAQPPEQVQAAFDDAVKANQDRERQINEGQAYYNDVVPKAQGTSARLIQEAQGYKERVISAAEGEADRFKKILAEFKKAPIVTRDRLYLDTIEQVLTTTTKIFIDQKNNSNLLFLPLEKILNVNQDDESQASSIIDELGQRFNTQTNRARDAFRGRDREQR